MLAKTKGSFHLKSAQISSLISSVTRLRSSFRKASLPNERTAKTHETSSDRAVLVVDDNNRTLQKLWDNKSFGAIKNLTHQKSKEFPLTTNLDHLVFTCDLNSLLTLFPVQWKQHCMLWKLKKKIQLNLKWQSKFTINAHSVIHITSSFESKLSTLFLIYFVSAYSKAPHKVKRQWQKALLPISKN